MGCDQVGNLSAESGSGINQPFCVDAVLRVEQSETVVLNVNVLFHTVQFRLLTAIVKIWSREDFYPQ